MSGRPAPGLVALALLDAERLRLAGTLLRPAPTLLLVGEPPTPMLAAPDISMSPVALPSLLDIEERSAELAERMRDIAAEEGFDVQAAALLRPHEFRDALHELTADAAIVAVATRSLRRTRALTGSLPSAALALPPGACPPTAGAVVSAADAGSALGVIARSLANDRVHIVGPPTVARESARRRAERLGLEVELVGGYADDAAITLAKELDGLLVACDGRDRRERRRVAGVLRRRPVLLVRRQEESS